MSDQSTKRTRKGADAVSMVEIPFSNESEQGVLGAILMDAGALDRVTEVIGENDFFAEPHRLIWAAIQKLGNDSKPVDVLTVTEQLESEGNLEKCGGFGYIGSIAAQTPSPGAAKQYAEIVRERAMRRRIIEAGQRMIDLARSRDGRTAEEVLDDAEREVLNLSETQAKSKETFQETPQVMSRVLERMEHLASNPPENGIIGTATGYVDLDKMTSGLHGGSLIILAARPAMGKTALAMNIAENVAIDSKKPVAIFSMEMGADELMQRIIGSVGRIDQSRMRTVNFTDDDWSRVTESVGKMQDAQFFIDETPALTVMDIRSRVRRLTKKVGPLGLVVIDYLQLLSAGSSSKNENRATVVGEFSRSLKMLAKELNIPIMALSQLNRSVEQRPNKRPGMADLRESGSLEQDADLVMFIYRDDYYNKDSQEPGVAEVIIGKHRAGPVGQVKLAFRGQYTRFENMSPVSYGYME